MNTARSAALVSIVVGAGFGIGSAVTLAYLARDGELPVTPFGFRSMAGGPFEDLDARAFQALGWMLVATCALDVAAGVWLWQGRRRGATLALATAPAELALGVGFALPFLLVAVPIRTALVLVGRRSLR
jgi:hypothetical protein